MTITTTVSAELRATVRGGVFYPGSAGWNDARAAWNLAVDQRPHAVVIPHDTADVAATVRYAAKTGLRVAPQGTGHNAAPLGDLTDTILLRTSAMRDVTIDPRARTARIQAGVVWAEVTAAAAEHGLAALAGSSPDVGVVGYCVGGGLSWLARRHGLACNSVEAFEVVTADGTALRVDADRHPDLFWALRGGGGSFAVVTALELRLLPIHEVHAGAMFWPIERAGEVLHAYRRWADGVPREVTSCGRILQLPPLPELPGPLRGRAFVVIETVALADVDTAAGLLAPLRALGPEIDTHALVPVETLAALHMDPPGPVPGSGDGTLLADLPADAVDALVAVAGAASGSPLLSVEVRHLGGAVGVAPRGAGAAASLDAGYALFAVGITPDAAAHAKVAAHVDAVLTALRPWDAGRAYLNFAERPATPSRFHAAETVARLAAVKATYDPEDRIRANHPVVAAGD
jgi:hypothetical protein